jgi:hypothetical protein
MRLTWFKAHSASSEPSSGTKTFLFIFVLLESYKYGHENLAYMIGTGCL